MELNMKWMRGLTSENSTDMEFNQGEHQTTICTNFVLLIAPHAIFIVLTMVQLVAIAFWRRRRRSSDIYSGHSVRHRLPAHGARWIFSFLLLVLGATSLAEGILSTDFIQGTPHFLLQSVFIIMGAIFAIACFTCAEIWRLPWMLWPLLCYWATCLVESILTMYGYSHNDICDGDFTMRSLLLILLASTYCILLILDICTVIAKLLLRRRQIDEIDSEVDDRVLFRDMDASFLSRLTFSWLSFLFVEGFKKPINFRKLGSIPDDHEAKHVYNRFKGIYDNELKRSRDTQKPLSLCRVIARVHWSGMCAAGVLKLVSDLLSYVGPLALGGITQYATSTLDDSEDHSDNHNNRHSENSCHPHDVTVVEFFSNGYVLVGAVFVSSIIQHVCHQTYQYWVSLEGLHVRSAIQSMVYEKSLHLSTYHLSSGAMSIGNVTNHISVDAYNIMYYFYNFNEIWAIPVKIGIALILLYNELGIAAIIAASFFVLVIPTQLIVATSMARLTKSTLSCADERIRASDELLQTIKQLKMYNWDHIYLETIKAVRNKELRHLLRTYILFAITFSINAGTPVIVTLIAFVVNGSMNDSVLTPDKAFTSLALFHQITGPLVLLPYLINLTVNLNISVKRLTKFLTTSEVQPVDAIKANLNGPPSGQPPEGGDRRMELHRKMSSNLPVVAECEDENEDEDDDEQDVFLSTNEVPDVAKLNGKQTQVDGVRCNGRNRPLDELPDDVAISISNGNFVWDSESRDPDVCDVDVSFPAGKLTMIIGPVGSGKSSLVEAILGEMTTLTGSVQVQVPRCKIAYAPQKAWLMNTTLRKNIIFGSKMSSTSYQKVIEACSLQPDIDMLPAKDRTEIGEKGILLSGGQKQRVSVARTLYSDSDVIILDDPLSALDMHVGADLFNKGIINILGRSNRTVILVTHQLQYLSQADKIVIMENGRIREQGSPFEIARSNKELAAQWKEAVRRASESEPEASSENITEVERRHLLRRCSQTFSILSYNMSISDKEHNCLIIQEECASGPVALSNYTYYLSAMGYPLLALILLSVMMRCALQMATDFWLSKWSQSGLDAEEDEHAADSYINGFIVLSTVTVASQVFFYFVTNAGILTAAKYLHVSMLENLIRIPVRIFDSIPIGRILNRLSCDTYLIDQRLLITINMLVNGVVSVIATIVVNTVVNPYFIIILVPVVILFLVILTFYIRTSRELQRIENVSRSPILAHFSETLGGLPTIRAFNSEARYRKAISEHISDHNTSSLYLLAAQRWLGIRLDSLGALIVLGTGLGCLLGGKFLDIKASEIGLAISYSLAVSAYLSLFVRSSAEFELQMNSVERVKYFIDLENEEFEGNEPPEDWPSQGEVRFENMGAQYAPDLPTVLKHVNINIGPRQKVGICGRTGSGKSSLGLTLFRLIDIHYGCLLIDGIDISTVPLRTLRQRLSIIPQDAVMFTGTIRSNLDPADTCNDEELWHALEIAQLKETVTQLDKGLDSPVVGGGENYSVGQRQLFCLARAFLRKSSILVMDEATASVDRDTDKILQTVVSNVFKDRTVFTIAHRMESLLHSDLIVTLGDGSVLEFDSPQNLLLNKNGVFTSLIKAGK